MGPKHIFLKGVNKNFNKSRGGIAGNFSKSFWVAFPYNGDKKYQENVSSRFVVLNTLSL